MNEPLDQDALEHGSMMPEQPKAVRSSEIVRCGLTKAEVNHILSLISTNEREGWYYGIAAQYWVRSDRIKAKLQAPNAPAHRPAREQEHP